MAKKKLLSNEELHAQLRELSRGASLTLDNAEHLFKEARVLCDHGAVSRALLLHQISLEECGKIEILGGWATSLLMGHEVNLKNLKRAILQHKTKNFINAYMLSATIEELKARADGDWERALYAFKQQQTEFHDNSNSMKNAALYVDYKKGKFSSPKERITSQMVEDIATLNSLFLECARAKVKMLSGWVGNEAELQQKFTWFESRLKELLDSTSPDQSMSILMRELREQGCCNPDPP